MPAKPQKPTSAIDHARCHAAAKNGKQCAAPQEFEAALFHGGRDRVPVQCVLWPVCGQHLNALHEDHEGLRMFDGLFWRIVR